MFDEMVTATQPGGAQPGEFPCDVEGVDMVSLFPESYAGGPAEWAAAWAEFVAAENVDTSTGESEPTPNDDVPDVVDAADVQIGQVAPGAEPAALIAGVDASSAGAFELVEVVAAWQHLLGWVQAEQAAVLRRAIRAILHELAPDAIADRRDAAARERYVTLTSAEHGMAWIEAYLPAEDAVAIKTVLDGHRHPLVPTSF